MDHAVCRVMTYNVHGGLDRRGRPSLDAVGETISSIRPGIAGLQEVEQVFRAAAGFADQPRLLAEHLGWDCRFAAAIDRDPGGETGKFGNAVLSVWPIMGAWSLPLPSLAEPRILLGASVQTPCGRCTFLVCHLGLGREERQRQVRAILDKAASLRGPFILAGDFNAPPDAPELAPLFAAWQEAQTACGSDQATFPPTKARIDFIFFSPEWRVLRTQVVPSPASDHWPLVTDLALT